VLERTNPNYGPQEYRVYSLLLIGMINWVELWFRAAGPVSRASLYDRIASLFLRGFMEDFHDVEAPAGTGPDSQLRAT